jgi:hypothetical protein
MAGCRPFRARPVTRIRCPVYRLPRFSPPAPNPYPQGANIAVIDPEVLDVFPDSAAVNRTLRALAPVLRLHIRPASKRKNA